MMDADAKKNRLRLTYIQYIYNVSVGQQIRCGTAMLRPHRPSENEVNMSNIGQYISRF